MEMRNWQERGVCGCLLRSENSHSEIHRPARESAGLRDYSTNELTTLVEIGLLVLVEEAEAGGRS